MKQVWVSHAEKGSLGASQYGNMCEKNTTILYNISENRPPLSSIAPRLQPHLSNHTIAWFGKAVRICFPNALLDSNYDTSLTVREQQKSSSNITSLPREMAFIIDRCHAWNVICNTRSNMIHPVNSPNTIYSKQPRLSRNTVGCYNATTVLSNTDCAISKQLFLQQPASLQSTDPYTENIYKSMTFNFESLFVALWGLHQARIGQRNGMIFCTSGICVRITGPVPVEFLPGQRSVWFNIGNLLLTLEILLGGFEFMMAWAGGTLWCKWITNWRLRKLCSQWRVGQTDSSDRSFDLHIGLHAHLKDGRLNLFPGIAWRIGSRICL